MADLHRGFGGSRWRLGSVVHSPSDAEYELIGVDTTKRWLRDLLGRRTCQERSHVYESLARGI